MPFICVLDSCSMPNTLFESSEDWVAHMTMEHKETRWSCMDRIHDDALSFRYLSEFKSHMLAYHHGEFEMIDLDDIADSCSELRLRDPILTQCPFCPEHESSNTVPSSLIGHVGRHLIKLAYISLIGHNRHSNLEYKLALSETSKGKQEKFPEHKETEDEAELKAMDFQEEYGVFNTSHSIPRSTAEKVDERLSPDNTTRSGQQKVETVLRSKSTMLTER